MARLSVDTGGTFTDVTLIQNYTEYTLKVRTTDDLISGIVDGIREILAKHDVSPAEIDGFSHGSTAALNAIIEDRGARTGLVTTAGFSDVIEIGRGQRAEELLYSPCGDFHSPIIPGRHRYEVSERINVEGEVTTQLDEQDLERVVTELDQDDVEAVAVCLLHSYRNDAHERRIQEKLDESLPEVDVSISSETSPKIREYRRMTTTAVDAYLKNIVKTYLDKLEEEADSIGIRIPINIMKSDGGAVRSGLAKERPVDQVISGPVAGVKAAQHIGDAIGRDHLISLDMGGTSCDTSIIDAGDPIESSYREIRGMPINGPFVRIDNIGAGGGSIAWLNEADELRVGPKSAGADPGPVCYGFGGERPTVTDADLLLGLLNPENFAGGAFSLDKDAARKSIDNHVAAPLGINVEEAAVGIRNVIDKKMAGSVRTVSIKEGYDPRNFALIAFGGAGPAHAGNVADELGIESLIFPHNPGTVSSLGCLLSDIKHTHSRSIIKYATSVEMDELNSAIDALVDRAATDFESENIDPSHREFALSFDMRYAGQAYNLNVETAHTEFTRERLDTVLDCFEREHRRRYGFVDEHNPIELVNVRITARGTIDDPERETPGSSAEEDARLGTREVVLAPGSSTKVPYYDWSKLRPGRDIGGPGIVESSNSTAWIPPEYDGRVDEFKNILASRQQLESERDGLV